MEEKKFSAEQPISLTLQGPEADKKITVRFPSDAEWIDRQRKLKSIIKPAGRGKSETITADSFALDLELVTKLRSDGGPEIDGYEAAEIINVISECICARPGREGACYVVPMRVVGGILTSHVLRVPSAKQKIQFKNAFARVLDMAFGEKELTINLKAAGDLYEALKVEAKGYEGAIPVVHKVAVVKVVLDEIEAGAGVADSENF